MASNRLTVAGEGGHGKHIKKASMLQSAAQVTIMLS
jgi:hypothetical protein